jgi:hypothetical protein
MKKLIIAFFLSTSAIAVLADFDCNDCKTRADFANAGLKDIARISYFGDSQGLLDYKKTTFITNRVTGKVVTVVNIPETGSGPSLGMSVSARGLTFSANLGSEPDNSFVSIFVQASDGTL